MSSHVEFYVDQGIKFSAEVIITEDTGLPSAPRVDLTNATLRSQIRKMPQSRTAYPFTVVIVDAVNGVVRLELSPTDSAAIPAGYYEFDAEYQIGTASPVRFLRGDVTVIPRITR